MMDLCPQEADSRRIANSKVLGQCGNSKKKSIAVSIVPLIGGIGGI